MSRQSIDTTAVGTTEGNNLQRQRSNKVQDCLRYETNSENHPRCTDRVTIVLAGIGFGVQHRRAQMGNTPKQHWTDLEACHCLVNRGFRLILAALEQCRSQNLGKSVFAPGRPPEAPPHSSHSFYLLAESSRCFELISNGNDRRIVTLPSIQ